MKWQDELKVQLALGTCIKVQFTCELKNVKERNFFAEQIKKTFPKAYLQLTRPPYKVWFVIAPLEEIKHFIFCCGLIDCPAPIRVYKCKNKTWEFEGLI